LWWNIKSPACPTQCLALEFLFFLSSTVSYVYELATTMLFLQLAILAGVVTASTGPRENEAFGLSTDPNLNLLPNSSLVDDFAQQFIAPPLPRNLRAAPRRSSWPLPNVFKRQNCQNGQNKCFADQNSWCACEESCCESSTKSYCCPGSLCDLANNLCAWPTYVQDRRSPTVWR
jgi:hypothetical protein